MQAFALPPPPAPRRKRKQRKQRSLMGGLQATAMSLLVVIELTTLSGMGYAGWFLLHLPKHG